MKGFVFISGGEIDLRFVSMGAFQEVERQHHIIYIALRTATLTQNGGVDGSVATRVQNLEWMPAYPERFRRWQELFDISCNYYKQRSTSFNVRYQELKKLEPARMTRLEMLARPGIFENYRRSMEKDMGVHPDLLAFILRERPDFFILPSSLLDYLTDDVLLLADTLSIPTLLLVAGWDNLSSKGVIHHHPTLMGVWGEQSRRHAVEIQGMSPEQVYVVGAPHYESFHPAPQADKAALRGRWGLPPSGHLILFAGTFRFFDETEVLQGIDRAIDNGDLPQMHILYRPHPWRAKRLSEDNFFNIPWRHITIDPEMAESYRLTKGNNGVTSLGNFFFRINHLTQVYQAVDAVISPMSTVLLEALLFGLPTMAMAFGDGKHSWSADKVSQMYHFKELYEIPGILVCRNKTEFFPMLRDLVASIGNETLSQQLRSSTHELVHQDSRSYADRVVDLVGKLLLNSNATPSYDLVTVKPGKRYKTRHFLRRVEERIKGLLKAV